MCGVFIDATLHGGSSDTVGGRWTLTARDITNILLSLAPPHLHGVIVIVTTINLLPVWLSPSIIVHRCRCHRQWIYCQWRCHWLYLFTGVDAIGLVTGNNCSLLSTTPVINLWLMSTRSVINENLWQGLIRRNKNKFIIGVVDNDEQIIAGALFANISPNFRKNSKHPHRILWGPGDTDSWKKSGGQKSVAWLPLIQYLREQPDWQAVTKTC